MRFSPIKQRPEKSRQCCHCYLPKQRGSFTLSLAKVQGEALVSTALPLPLLELRRIQRVWSWSSDMGLMERISWSQQREGTRTSHILQGFRLHGHWWCKLSSEWTQIQRVNVGHVHHLAKMPRSLHKDHATFLTNAKPSWAKCNVSQSCVDYASLLMSAQRPSASQNGTSVHGTKKKIHENSQKKNLQ